MRINLASISIKRHSVTFKFIRIHQNSQISIGLLNFFIKCKFCHRRIVFCVIIKRRSKTHTKKSLSKKKRKKMRWDTIWWPINIYILGSPESFFFILSFKVVRIFSSNNFVIWNIKLYGRLEDETKKMVVKTLHFAGCCQKKNFSKNF